MPLRLFAILSLAAALLAGPLRADEKPLVVLELFTSQGCSSCPPADAMIAELAGRDDVLALALHVDYWDYIGWADSFARPQNTKRQKAYARMAHSGSIYTPQIVVAGVDHVIGFKPMQVAELLSTHGDEMPPVEISVEQAGEGLRIRCAARAGAALPHTINVDLVGYIREASVDIAHGENEGKTITYANIVQSWDRLGTWNGSGSFEFEATLPEGGHYAVIVQAAGPGRVLAALRLP
ncbi:DUF1223 domain-containing protein [Sinisalibacter aestuarii]|uniref:DUF1223 domain-containing protein n=1 Tax=Sinisalibacter aestuarii TaxID=2949426 RepID=A0ABQ5LRZ3_9RHOB|nr:DUF1223 domain-containing protein [Sinisalibacter aestuarii]GKY87777.1 hypothetical protein STA1M1_16460 [Sinisalibacter aestuarii]